MSNSPQPSSCILNGGVVKAMPSKMISHRGQGYLTLADIGKERYTLNCALLECWMKLVDHFAEDACWDFLAMFVQEKDLNVPSAHGKPFLARWLISTVEELISAQRPHCLMVVFGEACT